MTPPKDAHMASAIAARVIDVKHTEDHHGAFGDPWHAFYATTKRRSPVVTRGTTGRASFRHSRTRASVANSGMSSDGTTP
jgi:hypothetical protein